MITPSTVPTPLNARCPARSVDFAEEAHSQATRGPTGAADARSIQYCPFFTRSQKSIPRFDILKNLQIEEQMIDF
jgi:hypothetical protein